MDYAVQAAAIIAAVAKAAANKKAVEKLFGRPGLGFAELSILDFHFRRLLDLMRAEWEARHCIPARAC